MKHSPLTPPQEAVEQAVTALDELEAAIDEHDNRKIGARLYELRRALQALKSLAEGLKQ